MIAQIATLFAATLAAPADLPRDPFQRTAQKALAGQFGDLHHWQRDAYARGLASGVTADKRAWLTAYYGNHPDGKRDRYGRPVTNRCPAGRSSGPRRAASDRCWTRALGRI